MLSLIGTFTTALALANTAPFLLISGQNELPAINGADMASLETSLSAELEGCGYDTYIFAHLDGVAEREINGNTMPQLKHLLGKSKAHRSLPAVSDYDSYQAQAESTVRDICKAQDVEVNKDGSYELFETSETRILEIELGSTPEDADKTLSHVIGHLNSANFLLVLRNSPPEENATDIESSKSTTIEAKDSNLFTDYIFFSPGIFMGILISATVGSVLVIALGWLNSLLVSYKAFEKQPEK